MIGKMIPPMEEPESFMEAYTLSGFVSRGINGRTKKTDRRQQYPWQSLVGSANDALEWPHWGHREGQHQCPYLIPVQDITGRICPCDI